MALPWWSEVPMMPRSLNQIASRIAALSLSHMLRWMLFASGWANTASLRQRTKCCGDARDDDAERRIITRQPVICADALDTG